MAWPCASKPITYALSIRAGERERGKESRLRCGGAARLDGVCEARCVEGRRKSSQRGKGEASAGGGSGAAEWGWFGGSNGVLGVIASTLGAASDSITDLVPSTAEPRRK